MIALCLQRAAEETRTVVDSRGVEVQIPAEINCVVTISDGLVEGTMTVLMCLRLRPQSLPKSFSIDMWIKCLT